MRIRMQNREVLLSWFGAQWKSWRMFWIIKRVQHIMNSNSIRLQTDLMPTGCEVVADNHYHAHFCERSPHCRRQQPLFHFQPSIYLCWTQSNTNLDFKLQPDLPCKLVQPVPLSPTMELVSSTMFQPPSVHWKRYICLQHEIKLFSLAILLLYGSNILLFHKSITTWYHMVADLGCQGCTGSCSRLLEGGVCGGTDVFKALALGASGVFASKNDVSVSSKYVS